VPRELAEVVTAVLLIEPRAVRGQICEPGRRLIGEDLEQRQTPKAAAPIEDILYRELRAVPF
jgi:hypothetical protein